MEPLTTYFASPERSVQNVINRQSDYFLTDRFFVQYLNFVPAIILILNEQRQAVFSNKALLSFLFLKNASTILGKRPGEILNCKNCSATDAGCGTTKFCRYCGAANAILKSQQGGSCISECRILALVDGNEEAFDFRVSANQFEKNGEEFTFFTVTNIADEKRRLFLENIFLHDLSNTCNALLGFSDLIDSETVDSETRERFAKRINFLSVKIADEIRAHRQLIAAEYNQLELDLEKINSKDFLDYLYKLYSVNEIQNERFLQIDEKAQSFVFQTDRALLSRVIGNMVKNALEGSVPNETVTMGCYEDNGRVFFWVKNPTYMPENIRLQLFNRSFSTKGAGRGLGTYSMKYFTEKYLQGTINFTSDENEGTVFTVSYPSFLQQY